MNKRIIKNEISNINPNTYDMHPITLETINNNTDTSLCLTKYNLKNNKLSILKYNCKTESNTRNQYMYIPPIGITAKDILEIYNIKSIDQLSEYINQDKLNDNQYKIERIINAWIRENFDTLKAHNNYLENICYKMIEVFYPNIYGSKHAENLDKDIKKYIDYWIGINNVNNFSLDLIVDLYNYLVKKYNNK